MKKTILSLGMVFLLLSISPVVTQENVRAEAGDEEVPSYAKWGRFAMKETKVRYPEADIVDYLHIGRETEEHTATEKFKLWLREGEKEFGVFIDIEFHLETEEVLNIIYEETDR